MSDDELAEAKRLVDALTELTANATAHLSNICTHTRRYEEFDGAIRRFQCRTCLATWTTPNC